MAPVLVVRLDPSDPPARLGEWLVASGLELDVRALDLGDALPDDLSGHDAVIVLGGSMGALDDHVAPYLGAVRALLRSAVSSEVPTLGVCLGHQLLAVANGGRVRRNPAGPEVGAQLVGKRAAGGTDPLFENVPITPDVIQWHHDEVHELPAGAILLAGSPGCDIQAFRLGRLAWGIQFHIENTADMVREWAAERDELLLDRDMDAVADRTIALLDDIAEVWQPFARRFAEIVRDPDSVAAATGVPTSTAAPITDPAAIRAALAAELTASRSGPTMLPMPGRRPAMPGSRPDET